MTRRMLALALILVALTLHAADAEARARGGGSRGSRTYSRPAAPPAAPATPASPARQPGATATSPTAPAASRGFFGPLAGGLAGFALGGLLGGLLFGHGMGAGIGLLDVLLVGGALYLLYRLMAARRGALQPAYAGPAGYAGAAAEAASSAASPPSGVVSAPTDLERGLDHIRQMDPAFEPRELAAHARELFSGVQRALGARDMRALAARLTPRMCAELTAQCDRLRAARRTNRVEAIAIQRTEVSEAWQESGHDYVTVYLAGSLMDYTVDDASGAVVEGQRAPQAFEEYWTFARPVGPQAWKLSAIQTA